MVISIEDSWLSVKFTFFLFSGIVLPFIVRQCMLQKSYLNTLRKQSLAYAQTRRDVIKQSDDALHHAKRAIFAMHREEMTEAKTKLVQAESILLGVRKEHKKDVRAVGEGSYRAAAEEYVEAALLYQFLTTGNIGNIQGIPLDPEVYIAGLCDVPGELYRYAIKSATEKNNAMVKKCSRMGQDIVGALIEFNLTSYLRNKFDQAKHAVQKLEEVDYELSMRG